MATITDDRETLQQEWLRDLQCLTTQVRGWCDANGWAVHVTDKPITESKLGEYSAPTLQVRAPNGTVIFVEPVARYVAGAEGLVDIYAWPSLLRLLLMRQNGGWTIKTDFGVPLPWKWSEQAFVEVVAALTSAA
jgi:hypothetical protein